MVLKHLECSAQTFNWGVLGTPPAGEILFCGSTMHLAQVALERHTLTSVSIFGWEAEEVSISYNSVASFIL